MKLAAELLFRLCRNVLVTDLTWPSYRYILDRTGGRAENQLTTLSLRKRILRDKLQPDELIEQVVRSFLRQGCDGLFLPAVDNLGVRLPVERIVRAIKERTRVALRGGGRCPGVGPRPAQPGRAILRFSHCRVSQMALRVPPHGYRILWPSAIGWLH